MPQPFRAVAPPPAATEKLLLLQSQNLALAFDVGRVQEVLLQASVTLTKQDRSVTNYRGESIPVVLGKKNCPAMSAVVLGIIKVPEIKGGFMAIACPNIPTLVTISPQDWQNLEINTSPWESDHRVYNFNGITFSHIIGIVRKAS